MHLQHLWIAPVRDHASDTALTGRVQSANTAHGERTTGRERVRLLTRRFSEAYMLMKYQNDAGTEVEWLWNSRDGVTPFSIGPKEGTPGLGNSLSHADWGEDAFVPNFVPPVGMRIFVTLTMDMALEISRKRVEGQWDAPDYPMNEHPVLGPKGKAGAARKLARLMYGGGDQPAVVTVDIALHGHFRDLALNSPFRPEHFAGGTGQKEASQ